MVDYRITNIHNFYYKKPASFSEISGSVIVSSSPLKGRIIIITFILLYSLGKIF